ncbi:MAG: cytochrome c [Pseudobacteriovorax sp.]|nr:cytochrome c [Pseudobacteriovorax sp.]
MKYLSLIVLVLSLVSCQLKPSDSVGSVDAPKVQFSLSAASLGIFRDSAQKLVIEVSEDNEGEIGGLLETSSFPLEEDGQYEVTGVSIGPKWFSISLRDSQESILASGSVRYVVGLGLQTLPEVVLTPTEPITLPLNLSLAVELNGFPSGPSADEPALREESLAIFQQYSCIACHNSSFPQGALDMESYPFLSSFRTEFSDIVNEVVKRINDDVRPMPPSGPRLNEDELSIVASWQEALFGAPEILLVDLVLNGQELRLEEVDGAFRLPSDQTIDVLAGDSLVLGIRVSTQAGVLLADRSLTETVGLDGTVSAALAIDYEEPVIVIPITIGE